MAIGMNASSNGCNSTKPIAIAVAATMPETKPMVAFTSVVPSAPKLAGAGGLGA